MANYQQISDRFGISPEDLQNLQLLGKRVQSEVSGVLDDFFQWVRTSAHNSFNYFSDEKMIFAIKEQHWRLFFEAEVDENYVKNRKETGRIHAELGLPIDIYLSYVSKFYDLFEAVFIRLELNTFELFRSFNKWMNMDVSIILEEHGRIINETIVSQNNALKEMATPVAQLWDDILLLPLVGVLDSKRANAVMMSVLNKIASTQAKFFILDISGVLVMDTAVANYLIKVVKGARLMGCQCLLSGISPSVAQTVVELGVHTDEVRSTSTMKDALALAFKALGTKL